MKKKTKFLKEYRLYKPVECLGESLSGRFKRSCKLRQYISYLKRFSQQFHFTSESKTNRELGCLDEITALRHVMEQKHLGFFIKHVELEAFTSRNLKALQFDFETTSASHGVAKPLKSNYKATTSSLNAVDRKF